MTYYGENPILDCVDGSSNLGSMSAQGRCTCTDPARTCECGDLGYDPDTYSPSESDERDFEEYLEQIEADQEEFYYEDNHPEA
jgi:hypothetical protein